MEFPDDHPDAWDGWWVHYWDLEEAVVVGSRPSALGPGLFDLVLEAEVIGPTTPTGRTGAVGEPESAEIGIHNGTGSRIGECRRIEGLYTERPEPEPEPLRLVGCEPTDRLLARLVHPRADGARPSRLGGALIDVDVTVRAGLGHRPPAPPDRSGTPGTRASRASGTPGRASRPPPGRSGCGSPPAPRARCPSAAPATWTAGSSPTSPASAARWARRSADRAATCTSAGGCCWAAPAAARTSGVRSPWSGTTRTRPAGPSRASASTRRANSPTSSTWCAS
ncbi:hypothetical protein ACFQ1I_37870 [Kitasatospora arboriphila]